MEIQDASKCRSHRDADSVDVQLLQTFNIGFVEPSLPMLAEGIVGGLLPQCLGEVTVDMS